MGRPSLVLLIGILAARPAAADCVDHRDFQHWTGQVSLSSFAVNQVVDGDRAYIAAQSAGLYVVDVTNPAAPTIQGIRDTPGSAWGIAKVGNYLLVGDGSNGLLTVDVSNPASPAIVSTWDPGAVRAVYVSGNVAYVAGGNGFYILDITNVTSPALLGSATIGGYGWDIDVSGARAYVAASDGLHIVDVANPASPTQTGFLAKYYTGGYGAIALKVRGNYAYVVEPIMDLEYGGYRVVDVSNPSAPVGGHIEWIYGGAVDVLFDGSQLVVSSNYGVAKYDLTNPAQPQVSETMTPDMGYGVTIEDGFLYYLSNGLQVVNLNGPPAPPVVATPAGGGKDICFSGNYAFSTSAANFGSLDVLDVSNPRNPSLVTSVSAHDAGAIAGQGNYVYVARNGITLYDITNPAAPAIRGSVSLTVRDLAVKGPYVYAVGNGKLSVVNVSNPLAPSLVRQIPLVGYELTLSLQGSRLYVSEDDSGVEIFDLTIPDTPALVGTIDTPGYAGAVLPEGNWIYVADGSAVRIYNVANPASPTPVGAVSTPAAIGSLAHAGNFLYVGDYGEGLEVLDVSNPASPVYVGSHRGVPAGGDVVARGDVIYVCGGYNDLSVIDQQCALSTGTPVDRPTPPVFRVGAPWPNPASASVRIEYETPQGFPMPAIEIFNVAGQRIRSLGVDSQPEAGSGTVLWDGTDDRGLTTPAGVYFIRFRAGDQTVVRRIVRAD